MATDLLPKTDERIARDTPLRGRLLVVTSNFPRWEGDSTTPFVLSLAKGLTSLGWDIDIAAPHAPGARTRETLSGIRVVRFRYLWPASFQTVCYGGGALVNLRKKPTEIMKLPALILAELISVALMQWRNSYDAIHAHWILPQGFVCAVVSRAFRVPLVISCHGSDLTALRGGFLAVFKRAALRRANVVTTNSKLVTDLVDQLVPNLERIEKIPMPSEATIEPDPARVIEIRSRYCGSGTLLVSVARLVGEKGVDDFLKALALLGCAKFHALIVGDGQDRIALEKLATDLGLGEQVSFVGWAEPAEVAAYLHAADIFVGLSKSSPDGWVEGFGLTFLEAMHAARPIVATRYGAIEELVQDRITGLLVPESSPKDAANAISQLIDDPERAIEMGLMGKRWLGDRFSESAVTGRFDELFRLLIET